MIVVELVLLIIAYTLLSICIFLGIICYKRKIESWETIAFMGSLLLLIVSMTVAGFLGAAEKTGIVGVFTLVSMVLVGLTTPLNCMEERQHSLSPIWKKILLGISVSLILLIVVGYFADKLSVYQYAVTLFLGVSVVLSMILIWVTKPQKRFKHIEKSARIFAFLFLLVVPIALILNFVFPEAQQNLKIGFILPLVFILLSANKIWDDLQRLSIRKTDTKPDEQHFKNFALTEREKEIATVLTKGLTYKQISEELHISIPTVKTHTSNIYKKCGVKNKSELILLLIK